MNKSFDYQIWKSVFIFYPLLAAKAKIAKKKNRCFFGRNCNQENLFWYYLTFTGLWKNYLVNVVLLPEKGYSCFSREADFFHLLSFSCVIFLAAVLRRASSRNQFPLARWLFHQVFMTWHDGKANFWPAFELKKLCRIYWIDEILILISRILSLFFGFFISIYIFAVIENFTLL